MPMLTKGWVMMNNMVKSQMRVNVKIFNSDQTLSCAHRDQMQGLVYEALKRGNSDYGTFLHQEGYRHPAGDNRRYKFFSFTSLLGGAKIKGHDLLLYPSGQGFFYVSSPDPAFVEAFQAGVTVDPSFGLGSLLLEVQDIAVMPLVIKNGTIVGRTLSPVVVTRPMPDGSPSHHLTFDDEGFPVLVSRNLAGKYSAWLGYEIPVDGISFAFFRPSVRESVVPFKQAKYKGVSGIFSLSCPDPEMLTFACLTGIGEKNSMGFGFVYVG